MMPPVLRHEIPTSQMDVKWRTSNDGKHLLEGPLCPLASGYCLTRKAADNLGSEIYEILMTFIWGAEPGARLVLGRGQTDFSLELSGGPRTGPGAGIDQEHMRQLRQRLESLRRIRPEK